LLKNTVLYTQDLRASQANESYIGLIQENSIESSVQNCLLYILKANGLYTTFLAYSNDYVLVLRPPHMYYIAWHHSF